jgi:hypothetical protein
MSINIANHVQTPYSCAQGENMKKRSLPKMFGLFIITLGIYRLYWFAKTRQEMLAKNPKLSIPSIWLLVAPYVLIAASVIFLIVSLVGSTIDAHNGCNMYRTGSAQYEQCVDAALEEPSGLQLASLAGVYLSAFLLFPLTAWWMWYYSKAVEVVTKEKLSFALSMIVLLAVPDGLDMLVVQDSFNKLAVAKSA